MKLVTKALNEIIPYENNPRVNDEAVPAVMESIRQCGYISPIVLDEDGVILAGHTRFKALQALGRETASCVIVTGLSEEQRRKFRILDNKVGEFSDWDYYRLPIELEGLDFGDLDIIMGTDWGRDTGEDGAEENLPLDLEEAPDPEAEDRSQVAEPEVLHCPKCGFAFEVKR